MLPSLSGNGSINETKCQTNHDVNPDTDHKAYFSGISKKITMRIQTLINKPYFEESGRKMASQVDKHLIMKFPSNYYVNLNSDQTAILF